jgi:hypothetical protein
MRRGSVLGGAVVLAVSTVFPASGEDSGIYAFIHSEARGRAYVPVAPQFAPPAFEIAPRRTTSKPEVVRLPEETAPVTARDPKTIGEVSNPVPALLSDKTLRPGDFVVFPDGLRVFRGQPGNRHKLADFQKLGGTKRLTASERRLLAIVVGQNDAWSAEGAKPGKVAESRREVDATGSTRRSRRTR